MSVDDWYIDVCLTGTRMSVLQAYGCLSYRHTDVCVTGIPISEILRYMNLTYMYHMLCEIHVSDF